MTTDVPRSTAIERLLALLILGMTAVLCLLWSHASLMDNDEFLSFYTDSQPTVASVIDVQLHYPLSLDPPAYHLLSHAAMDVLGRNALAERLPALAGFLLMQLSVFVLVGRIAGGRAAVLAMLLPLATASYRYSVEGRPYGLLLGLDAAAFACWYCATLEPPSMRRTLWLCGMAAAMATAISSHYFGILILAPIAIAELARTVQRRKLDVGMAVALACAAASVAFILPFRRALQPYRAHYYIHDVQFGYIWVSYRALFYRTFAWSPHLATLLGHLLFLGMVLLFLLAVFHLRHRGASESLALWIGLAALAALPFFGFLLGRYVTHTAEARYTIASVLGFTLALSLLLARILRHKAVFCTLLAAFVSLAAIGAVHSIRESREETAKTLASLRLSPQLSARLAEHPDAPIFVTNIFRFFIDTYYTPNVALRSHFTLTYDQAAEMRWLHYDTNSVANRYMVRFLPFSSVSYADFLRRKDPLLLSYSGFPDWLVEDLASRGMATTPLGSSMGGQAYKVHTPAAADPGTR